MAVIHSMFQIRVWIFSLVLDCYGFDSGQFWLLNGYFTECDRNLQSNRNLPQSELHIEFINCRWNCSFSVRLLDWSFLLVCCLLPRIDDDGPLVTCCDSMHILFSIGNKLHCIIGGQLYPCMSMDGSQLCLTFSHKDRHGGMVWSKHL